jgi:hypothetical protein
MADTKATPSTRTREDTLPPARHRSAFHELHTPALPTWQHGTLVVNDGQRDASPRARTQHIVSHSLHFISLYHH